eukprot:ANDGO_01237.mRNA.1 hypothetical protein
MATSASQLAFVNDICSIYTQSSMSKILLDTVIELLFHGESSVIANVKNNVHPSGHASTMADAWMNFMTNADVRLQKPREIGSAVTQAAQDCGASSGMLRRIEVAVGRFLDAAKNTQPVKRSRSSGGVGILLTVTPEEGLAVKIAFTHLCDVGKTAKNVPAATRNQILESLCKNEDAVLPDFLDWNDVSVECVEDSAKLSEEQDHPLRFQTFIFRSKSHENSEVYRLHHINSGDVQGAVHFAVVVPHLLRQFEPSHVLVSGVCAGYPDNKNEIGFGTVVAATDVFSVTRGKATHSEMQFDILKISLNSTPGANLQALISSTVSVWNAKIADPVSGLSAFIADSSSFKKMLDSGMDAAKIKANALTGSIGCALDFVKEDLKTKEDWDALRKDTASRKLRAIEMEGVGIAEAIAGANKKPVVLFQKSVMDFAGPRSDAAKPYASFISALFATQFLFCSVLPELYR